MKGIHWFFTLCTLVLTACQGQSSKEIKEEGKSIVQYAKHFAIIPNENGCVIQIFSPEDHSVEKTIEINNKKAKISAYPIEKMAVLSSTHVGMLNKLDAIDRIVGVSSSLYIHNPKLLKKVKEKKVFELGEESQIPVESIIKSGCQAIFYSGFGKEFPHADQLEKVGIECIVNYDWREIHPLGKAEWILLFGYLIGQEQKAQDYFNSVVKKYNQLKKKAEHLTSFPTVLSGNLWSDQWNAPAGESFNALFFKDAHANYVYADTKGTGSVIYSLEKVTQDNIETEYWLNTGIPSKKLILNAQPKLQYLGPFKKNNIYDYSKAGNRFWEESAIEPHKVLEDYIKILHPTPMTNPTYHFYEKVN
jgi:iron complex transport system substrate-binding protein